MIMYVDKIKKKVFFYTNKGCISVEANNVRKLKEVIGDNKFILVTDSRAANVDYVTSNLRSLLSATTAKREESRHGSVVDSFPWDDGDKLLNEPLSNDNEGNSPFSSMDYFKKLGLE